MKRIFIVGCPRSGTTLVQSILASHSKLYSLPETHLFIRAQPKNILKRIFTTTRIRTNDYLAELSSTLEVPKETIRLSPYDNYATHFQKILDYKAQEKKCFGWIEKTPIHLHYIDDIQRWIPNPSFLHVRRSAHDNVLSLYKARQHKEWHHLSKVSNLPFRQTTIRAALKRWQKDNKISDYWSKKENHYQIKYEDLISNPTNSVADLCHKLNINFEPDMLLFNNISRNIIHPNERWKKNNFKKTVEKQQSDKNELSNRQLEYLNKILKVYG